MSFHPPAHARTFQLVAGQSVQALSVALDPNDGQWLCRVQNTTDGPQGVLQVTARIAGLQGTGSVIFSQVGNRAGEQFYLTGTSTIDVASVAFNASFSIWIEKANAIVAVPPSRFTAMAAGAAAYIPMSNTGYPTPYMRHYTLYSDVSIDVRIVDENGAILFDRLNITTAQLPLLGIIPPGTRLTAKSNLGNANITAVWHQNR